MEGEASTSSVERNPAIPRNRGAGKPSRGNTVKGLGVSQLYGTRVPRSRILDLLRPTISESRLRRIEETLLARCGSTRILFENLHDPGNGAAAMRTAEGHGLQHVHVVEGFEPFYYSQRINRQVDKWMTIHRHSSCFDAIRTLKSQGFTIVGTCLDPTAQPLESLDFGAMEKVVMCFGNEDRGLSQGLRNGCDHKVYIPMRGFAESFNISVTVALVIYHLKMVGRLNPDLDDEELASLYEKWVVKSCKRAKFLLEKHGIDYPHL